MNDIYQPKLLDNVGETFSGVMERKLEWLDNAYGKVERITKDGRTIPATYKGGKDYISLMPDKKLGNYCFLDINDPVNIKTQKRGFVILQFTASIVFWYDLRTIYPKEHEHKTDQHVLDDVTKLITEPHFTGMIIQPIRLFQHPATIFQGYTLGDNNALQRPYSGFRIEVDISYKESC